jgi:tetratricopeptide (TPR) repeat protein
MDVERRKRIYRIVDNYKDIEAFSIGTSEYKQIVLRYKPYIEEYVDLTKLINDGNKAYNEQKYDECINMIKGKLFPRFEIDYNSLEQANILLFLGDAYFKKNKMQYAIENWTAAILTEKKYRDPYLRLASYYNDMGFFNLSLGYLAEAERTSERLYSWLEQDRSWTVEPCDLKAIAHYYLKHYDLAYEYGKEALVYEPNNKRLLTNLSYYKSKIK